MEIRFLTDCREFIPAIACLQQMEMYKIPSNRNLLKAIKKFEIRSKKRDGLPLTLVAFMDTLPVGSICLIDRELDSHTHLSPWIAPLFVSSHYRNRGIGKSLMEEAERLASSLGHKEIFLFTDAAREYYEKLNWETIETVYPTGKPTSFLMKKIV
ncbi:GNAT family N-acetyltransferase [Bacillus salitolerans]|uniref:GNAT family N-acetyltransferase n=1 Tax=Bacillus salitolerans TaxID=1437434 RepID=A0ABW4LM07_9BACI